MILSSDTSKYIELSSIILIIILQFWDISFLNIWKIMYCTDIKRSSSCVIFRKCKQTFYWSGRCKCMLSKDKHFALITKNLGVKAKNLMIFRVLCTLNKEINRFLLLLEFFAGFLILVFGFCGWGKCGWLCRSYEENENLKYCLSTLKLRVVVM